MLEFIAVLWAKCKHQNANMLTFSSSYTMYTHVVLNLTHTSPPRYVKPLCFCLFRRHTNLLEELSRTPSTHLSCSPETFGKYTFFKAEKCKFHAPSVSFLGFIVEKGQFKSDPYKIQAVAEWPVPTSRKQLQRSLGFANFYRRFVRDFSPLHVSLPPLCLSPWPQKLMLPSITSREHLPLPWCNHKENPLVS